MEPFNPGGVPNLFGEFGRWPTNDARYAYVEHVLTQLAKSDDLYLTDVLNQPEPVRTYAIEVICGLRREPVAPGQYEQKGGYPIAAELDEYRVRIRSIPWLKQFDKDMPDGTWQSRWEEVTDQPIRFQLEKKRLQETMTYEAAKQQLGAWAKTPGKYVENWYETDKSQVDLSVKYAVWALSQYGKNVKRAPSRRQQRTLWRFEEVHPHEWRKAAEPQDEPVKRGRGRPRKTETVAHAD